MKGIDTMMNVSSYLSNANSVENLSKRLEILRKLPSEPFYASDLGISGGLINSLCQYGIIKEVPSMKKDAFVCVDEDEELYKKIVVHCWVVKDWNLMMMQMGRHCKNVVDVMRSHLPILL